MKAKFGKTRIDSPQTENDEQAIAYPSSDGEPIAETDHQYTPLTETVSTLRHRFRDRSDVYIAGALLVYCRKGDPTNRVAPDILAVFEAKGNHPRDSWLVWEEGKSPDFVMEIVSEGSWQRDSNEKRVIYAELGVTEYWLFDPKGEYLTPVLRGMRLIEREYQGEREYEEIRVETDTDGILRGYSEIFSLDICVRQDGELRLYDPENRTWLLTHAEEGEGRLAAEAEGRLAEREGRLAEREGRLAAEAEVQRLREQIARRTLRE